MVDITKAVAEHEARLNGTYKPPELSLQEKVPTIRIPPKAAPEAFQAGQAAAQRAANVAAQNRLGMIRGGGLMTAAALAPGVGGALGYGAGALSRGEPVVPAMKEGFGAGYGMVGKALGIK